MSDRFEESLREALHGAELPAAPEGLRRGLEELPMGISNGWRRGRLSRSTMRSMQLTLAGLAGAAVMAVAIFGFWLPLSTHPGAGTSPEASPAIATFTKGPSASPTATASASAWVTPSAPTPTPATTPAATSTSPASPKGTQDALAMLAPRIGAYFNGRYVLIGRDAGKTEAAWIGDGKTWQRIDSPALAAMDVSQLIQIGARLFAFGWEGAADPGCAVIIDRNAVSCAKAHKVAIAVTADGTTWTGASADVFGNTLLVAAAGSSMGGIVFGLQCLGAAIDATCGETTWYTTDGDVWITNAFSSGGPVGFPAWDIRALAVTSAGLYGFGATTSWVSIDGSAWQSGALPPLGTYSAGVERLFATSGGLVATDSSTCPPYVATSLDGLVWTRQTPTATVCGTSAGDGDDIVVLGQDGKTIWTSADGRAWTRLGSLSTAVPTNSLVILGPSGVVVVTPNGKTHFLDKR